MNYKAKQKLNGLGILSIYLIGIMFFICLASSWFVNIYKFTQLDFEPPYKAEFIRVIGIPFAPLGMIVGYMDIGEENK